jgi:alpha-acetolactate decarboxylase
MADKREWSPSPSMMAVYSGRVCIGHLLKRGRIGIEAFDIDGRSVGLFGTMHSAIAAVSSREAADVGQKIG